MELTSEDTFRLNVLLASQPLAIRIDESRLIVHGLSEQGEARVDLHPNGRSDAYLRAVRELISGHVLGSPGGYPVYLRRWTRMGQMRDQSLEQLLLLGEPEAIVAAAGAPGLTENLARRAWWAMPDAENARRMLRNPTIAASTMGPVLAAYLIDYLPFETDSDPTMESVRLVLQPGLIGATERIELWKKAVRRQTYLVGFLRGAPDDLPEPPPPRGDAGPLGARLAAVAEDARPLADLLLRCLGRGGQGFLHTLDRVLAKPPNQEVVSATFDLMRDYFGAARPAGSDDFAIEALCRDSEWFVAGDSAPPLARACLRQAPDCAPDLAALRLLSGVGYGLLRPVLPDPSTQGTLMRRRLGPVIAPLRAAIARLRGSDAHALDQDGAA